MDFFTAQESMLYCPKCRTAYKEGAQRFCTNDGSRLLPPASQGKSGAPSKGVFTSVLSKTLPPDEKKINSAHAHFIQIAEKQPEQIFQPPADNEVLLTEQIRAVEEIKIAPEINIQEPHVKPLPRLIRPDEIGVSQAQLGDRSVNPGGRLALTWENTEILIGRTVKGRYLIVEQLSEDELSVAYLAEDKIVVGRKAVVRVLMVEKHADDYLGRIFAEERVSLSHINHPNVAHLFDSGELPEGKIFIVTEYIEGISVKEKLGTSGTFNPQRAARIIRQVANALSEVHGNGVLHRNLKPQNIILSVSENGIEQVKVTDFAVYDGFEEQTQENIKYLSPEQLEGKMPSFASDIFSLAVIAYQMLTGRLPFNYSTEKELLKAQREGLDLRPTDLRLDLPKAADDILEKALAYKSSERFPNARDFGDAFYNALSVAAPWEIGAEEISSKEMEIQNISDEVSKQEDAIPVESPSETADDENSAENIFIPAADTIEDDKTLKTSEGLPWEKRSPEPLQTASSFRVIAFALGLILLGIGTWASWNYYSQRQGAPIYVPQNNAEITSADNNGQNQSAVVPETENANLGQVEPPAMDIETPPLTRQITPPPNSEYFQNSKENLKGDLAKNFRAFSFYYPNDWTRGESETNFIDVARIGATGTPIEQILVSYYDSKGTLTADMERFSKLVDESNKYFAGQFPNYRLLSEGETKINGDWKAYEMKFQGEGVTVNGDKVTIWGRRLWMPAARQGVKSGFVITMLATSLSPEVKSANDVGVKGELASVLQTFEPASLDSAY